MQQYRELKAKVILSIKGLAMGTADIIPGVSGGTIALITGIYEDLIAAISAFKFEHIKNIFQLFGKNRNEAWQNIKALPWNFVLPLLVGILGAIAVMARIIPHLIETYPFYTYGFFFGLILFSLPIPFSHTEKRPLDVIVALIAAVAIFFLVGFTDQAYESDNLLYIFLSGAVAICAMVLPGISGAYILVLLGVYKKVVSAIKEVIYQQSTEHLLMVGVFISGVLVGIFSFVRLLKYLINHYQSITMAALTGLMLGSLRKLYPFEHTTQTPADLPFGAWLILIGLFFLAFVLVLVMYRSDPIRED